MADHTRPVEEKEPPAGAGAPIFEWSGVSVALGDKVLLSPNSGTLQAGELVCIMGPSGAGKTTLLSAIFGDKDLVQGTVHLHGESLFGSKSRASRRRHVACHMGYVRQKDIFIESLTVCRLAPTHAFSPPTQDCLSGGFAFMCLLPPPPFRSTQASHCLLPSKPSTHSRANHATHARIPCPYVPAQVRETLLFTARLRLPAASSAGVVEARVADVVNGIGLHHTLDTKIGTTMRRGVSGGELKRVNIATELLSMPKVLLLDEPTSGLDSTYALTVISKLRAFVRAHGVGCLCTLHQPSSQILELLDRVVLMAPGGAIVFSGAPSALAKHLDRLGLGTPDGLTLADHAMQLLCDPDHAKRLESEWGGDPSLTATPATGTALDARAVAAVDKVIVVTTTTPVAVSRLGRRPRLPFHRVVWLLAQRQIRQSRSTLLKVRAQRACQRWRPSTPIPSTRPHTRHTSRHTSRPICRRLPPSRHVLRALYERPSPSPRRWMRFCSMCSSA